VKVNIDRAARGYPGFAACAGIFHGCKGEYIGSLSSFLGVQKSLYTEVYGSHFLLLSLLGTKDSNVFGLSVTILYFVKHFVCLISFLGL